MTIDDLGSNFDDGFFSLTGELGGVDDQILQDFDHTDAIHIDDGQLRFGLHFNLLRRQLAVCLLAHCDLVFGLGKGLVNIPNQPIDRVACNEHDNTPDKKITDAASQVINRMIVVAIRVLGRVTASCLSRMIETKMGMIPMAATSALEFLPVNKKDMINTKNKNKEAKATQRSVLVISDFSPCGCLLSMVESGS